MPDYDEYDPYKRKMYTKELKQLWLHMVLFHELTITCMIANDHQNAFFVIKTRAGLETNTTSLPAHTTHTWPFKICFYWQSHAWWFRIFLCVNAVPVYKRKQNEAQLPILTEQFNLHSNCQAFVWA